MTTALLQAETDFETAAETGQPADWETAARALFKVRRKPKKARRSKTSTPFPLYDVLLEDGELFTVPVEHGHPDPLTSAGHKARGYWTGRQLQYAIWRGESRARAPDIAAAPAVADTAPPARDAWLARYDNGPPQIFQHTRADMQAIAEEQRHQIIHAELERGASAQPLPVAA